jgi:ribosomal subunit interface protein
MDVFVTGRNVSITDRFEDYATERSERVSLLAPKAIALEIRARRHAESRGAPETDRVELTLFCPGPLVRAEADGRDKYVAFDAALDKLVERLRQVKDRRKVHRGQHRPANLREIQATGFGGIDVQPASVDVLERVSTGQIPVQADAGEEAEADYTPVVIREKVFPCEHMTAQEAVDRMELVGHDFFLFVDSATDRPAVVYRRVGWDYGVIELEEQGQAQAPAR